jgi:hypothetical protein
MICILLSHLLEVVRQTGSPGPGYCACNIVALDGRISAERGENGFWAVAVEDLRKVASALGYDDATAFIGTA